MFKILSSTLLKFKIFKSDYFIRIHLEFTHQNSKKKMKSAYNPQERIRLIMNKIDAELFSIKQLNTKANHIFKECINDNKQPDVNEEESKINDAYRQRAVKAYKQRKIFTIYGNFVTIRRALLRRGWIEKCAPGRLQNLEKLPYVRLLKGARKGNEYEIAILSKLVSSYPANFIWQPKYFKDQYIGLTPFRNRVRRTRCMDFSTKVGLIACFESSHWNTIEDVAETSYMPSYKLSTKEDELYFLDDFRITQCISILVYLIEHKEPNEIFDKFGVVPTSVLEFPIKRIENFCKTFDQDDMEIADRNDDSTQWERFTLNMNLVLKQDQKILGSEADCSNFLIKIQQLIQKTLDFRPFLFSYGFRNLWILKPGFQCRGQGIVIMDNFHNIVNYAAKKSKANYVVQKYIEKPFLVYKTKFDIRQYMLLTIFDVISIWMYKDCYLRFSSREFNLADLREVIHITNNSIQKKYKNAERDPRLPVHNMWSLSDFQYYLNEHGQGETWQSKIYPGLKKNIIAVVLASLEETELTPNSFEIYGCDFMLDEKLDPFLIEINSTPDMSPSTPVTARICASALDDLMKVIIDHPKNSKISTGKFELIYQIDCPRNCNNSPDLVVAGTAKKLHTPVTLSKNGKIKRFIKRKILRKQRSHPIKAKDK